MNSFEFLQPLTAALGWTLLHFLWQGTLIALLLASASVLLRRAGANVRYVTACVAMLVMLAVSVTTFLWIRSGSLPVPHGVVEAPRGVVAKLVRPSALAGDLSAPTVTAAPIMRLERWLDGRLETVVLLWFLGVVILSLRTAGGWVFAQRLKRCQTHPAGPEWQQRLVRLAVRLSIRRGVTLCESALAKVPTVIGWLRPVILLPASALAGMTPELMEAVLAHELAHIRRHDYLLNMLQTAVETLLFYHPAVWWVGKRIRQERENCCDDLAVAACGNAITYARALTELEQIRSAYPQLAMAATGGSLLARIRRVIGVRQPDTGAPSTWLAGVVALLSFGAVWASGISFSYHDGDHAASAAVTAAAPTAEAQITEPQTAEAQTAEAQTAGAEEADSSASEDEQETPAAAPGAQSPAKESGDYIGGLSAAGYKNLSVDQLITFKIHGVTPEFIREIEAMGLPRPTPDELVTMKIHGLTPEFVNELKTAGFSRLSIDQLVAFKIHGVEPKRLGEMQKLWGKLSADQVVALKIHGVTPEFAKDLKAAGITALDLEQLTAFKIHGVDPARIAEMQKLGFGPLTPDNVLALQIHGVTPEFLRAFRELGFTKLTLDEALAARIHGVTPDFVKEARKHGFDKLSLEQIIKLKQFDILTEGGN